jgi:hypothetical protein
MGISVFLMTLLFSSSAFSSQKIFGDWIETRRYDYRYVSTYEVSAVSQPLKIFPWIEEDCHDDGDRFANWVKTIRYQMTYSGIISFKLLGVGLELGGESAREIEFVFERWIHATKGIKARHTLFEEYENWVGTSKVEFRYPDGTQEFENRTYPFTIKKVNYGLRVERKIIQLCDGNQ